METLKGNYFKDKSKDEFARTLKTHEKIHNENKSDEKIFECNTCGKVFDRLKYLKRHGITHTA